MVRRWGWVAVAVASALMFLGTALAGAWTVGIAISDGGRWGLLTALVPVGFGLVFWRWIALGAWLRAYPPLDPETGEPMRAPEEVGPWGVVGRVLLGLMVVGFVGVGVWALTVDRRATQGAEDVRDQAQSLARRRGLTAADVADAQAARQRWLVRPDRGPDPFRTLLPVDGAVVERVSAGEDGAAILLRPNRNPPCVVVTIDRNDLVRSRLSSDCA